MICTIISCDAKVASNGNHYLDIVAQPANDPWSEPIQYRLFGPAERCAKLASNPPKTINLGRVKVTVARFMWVRDAGELSSPCNHVAVTCRFNGDECVDDAQRLAIKYLDYLIEAGKATLCEEDAFDGLSANE